MSGIRTIAAFLLFFIVVLAVPMAFVADGTAAESKKMIYDEAGLLDQAQYETLNTLANQYGADRETDMIVVTSNNDDDTDVMKLTEVFYDEKAPGYDKPHGNAVILYVDMKNRAIYLAGFYKAETYLDDTRLDKIRSKITPYLTSGDYALAFRTYIETAHHYMGYRPGVNPDNILFKLWFQLAVSFVVGGVIVGVMAYRSGGRITVDESTYEDEETSGVVEERDDYIRTTVTRRKIERSSSSGGGTTSGGHSHSGSRGSF